LEQLPELTGLNQVAARARRDSCSPPRVTAPEQRSAAAVGRFGKGRTLALMTDGRLALELHRRRKKETPQNHLKLIRQPYVGSRKAGVRTGSIVSDPHATTGGESNESN